MGLWNYCEVCGERIETGQPCIGVKEESENLCGLSICMNCAEIENLPDGREPVSITDLLARVEAADILGDNYDLDRLRELVEADRDGRCVVLPAEGYTEKDGENALKSAMNTCFHHNNPVTRYIADAVAEKLTREAAEAAMKASDRE